MPDSRYPAERKRSSHVAELHYKQLVDSKLPVLRLGDEAVVKEPGKPTVLFYLSSGKWRVRAGLQELYGTGVAAFLVWWAKQGDPGDGPLDLDEAMAVLNMTSYKSVDFALYDTAPRLEAFPYGEPTPTALRIQATAYPIDADNVPKRIKVVVVPSVLALPTTKVELLDHVRRLLHEAETHEADEWFRFGGERVYDPHAGDSFA